MRSATPPAAVPAPEVPPGLWQQRPFRLLSYTRFTSRVANYALNFALILLVVEATDLAFMSALLVLALVVPSTLAGLVAGVAADSFPKRLLVFTANLAKGGACLAFVLLEGGVAGYFALAFLLATLGQFAGAAEASILPAVVEREELVRANAFGQAVAGIAQVIGFGVVTPVFLRLFDSPNALILACGGLYVLAALQAVFIGRVRRSLERDVGGQGSWLLAGWREIQRQSSVRRAVVQITLISTTLIILAGIIPAYLHEELALPVDLGAVVLMPAALGVALGLRVAGFLARFLPHALLSSVGFAGFVTSLGLLAFVNEEATFLAGYGAFEWLDSIDVNNFDGGALLAMIIVAPLGFCFALVTVAAQTVMNALVPLHLQGRVLATQGALAAVAASAPVLIAGALTDLTGAAPVIAILAILMGATAILSFRQPHRVGARVAPAAR